MQREPIGAVEGGVSHIQGSITCISSTISTRPGTSWSCRCIQTRAAAEIAAGEMLRRFEVNQRSGPDFRGEAVSLEPLPPKEQWNELFDDCDEGVHLYRIELDGKPAAKIQARP